MRLHRFYIPTLPTDTDVFSTYEAPLIHQIKTVFRMTTKDHILVFNGTGTEYEVVIDILTKNELTGTIVKQSTIKLPERKRALAFALLKSDHSELVCQKATELGITDIYPLITDRTIKQTVKRERLEKIIIEAVEQSGRNDIPHLHESATLEKVFEVTKDIYTQHVASIGATETLTPTGNTIVYIGPEGGWSPEEEQWFKDSAIQPISLGTHTLRAETAAIVVSAIM